MRYLWFLLLLLPLALSPFPYYLTLLNFFALSAMVALSLYVLTGLAGMTSFAQAAFMGMGAYATALLTVKAGLSPWLGLGAGLLSALLLALLLGALTVRLKGHFLPLSTIAWQVALYILAGNLVGLTGGHTGLTDLPPIHLFGVSLDTGFPSAWARPKSPLRTLVFPAPLGPMRVRASPSFREKLTSRTASRGP